MVKISAQDLDRVKQNRNGVAEIPRKHLEEKAKVLADRGEWVSFIDILARLVFGVVPFPNVDGLVDLAAIDAFLAYHCWISPAVTFCSSFSSFKYIQGKSGLPESAPDRQVFKN